MNSKLKLYYWEGHKRWDYGNEFVRGLLSSFNEEDLKNRLNLRYVTLGYYHELKFNFTHILIMIYTVLLIIFICTIGFIL